jgi:hypothetical protein
MLTVRSHSKKLYESIPKQHRPPLDITDAGKEVGHAFSGATQNALGSTIIPIVFPDAITGKKFCIKLYALVLDNFSMPMFIGQIGTQYLVTCWTREAVTYDMDFGNGNKAQVVYRL